MPVTQQQIHKHINITIIKKPSIYFPNLDSLRFIAFLLVFLQHGFFNAFKGFLGWSSFTDKLIKFFFTGGGTGVQVFFVLSGFLITYLLITEIRLTGKINILQFYLRRVLRIWPLYYATVIFAFIIYPGLKDLIGINSDLCSRPWYYFTFLANFDNIYIAQNCPGRDALTQSIVWSVSIEEQFYIFWPILVHIFRKHKLYLVFIFVIIASAAFRYMNAANGTILYFHTFAIMGDLAMGSLAAYLVIKNNFFSNLITHLPRNIIIVCYSLILMAYFFSDIVFNFPGSTVFSRFIFDLFWVFLILEQCFSQNSIFTLGKIRSFTFLGKISYGLYMLHPVAILMVDITLRMLKVPQKSFVVLFLSGVVALIISVVLAKLSYDWLEKPFLRLKRRYSVIPNKIA